MKHVLFCVKLYRKQMDAGRFFLHEHPWGAWSWSLPEVRELRNEVGVKLAKGNMCAQGMKLRDELGEAPLLKATGWLSNSECVLEELSAKCSNNGGPNDHRHANLQHGVAAQAAIWPEKLCYSILRGLRKELCKKGVMHNGDIGSVCEDNIEYDFQKSLGSDPYFVDDVSGSVLDSQLVRSARADEVKGVCHHKLFDKVPIERVL